MSRGKDEPFCSCCFGLCGVRKEEAYEGKMAQPEGKSSLPCLVWGLTPEISTLEMLRGRLGV